MLDMTAVKEAAYPKHWFVQFMHLKHEFSEDSSMRCGQTQNHMFSASDRAHIIVRERHPCERKPETFVFL